MTPVAAKADVVEMGTDYFTTLTGTYFNFPGIGVVDFVGSPAGGPDTEIQRLRDVSLSGGTTPLRMLELSLVSAAPVTIGGFQYNVNVGLNPAVPSTGSMQIFGSGAGGTFNSRLNVNFDASFTPVGSGPAIPTVAGSLPLVSIPGSQWSPTPPTGAALAIGPDSPIEGSPADLPYNMHTGLDRGEVDFFPIAPLTETHPSGAQHVVGPTAAGGLLAVGDIVGLDPLLYEGTDGVSVFTVFNTGAAATINAINGISVVQDPTLGDPTDYANMVGPLGGTCVEGNVLAAGDSCTVAVNFVTAPWDNGPPLDGVTPFDLTISLNDGRTATATQYVYVSDPEPASLSILAAGLAGLGLLRRRRASRRSEVT